MSTNKFKEERETITFIDIKMILFILLLSFSLSLVVIFFCENITLIKGGILFFLVSFGVIYFRPLIKTQRIRNQKTLVYYAGFALIGALFLNFLYFICTHKTYVAFDFFNGFIGVEHYNWALFIYSVAISGVFGFVFWKAKKSDDFLEKAQRFSSSAISTENDSFGFNEHVQKTKETLLKYDADKYVSTFSVCAKYGEGKSTYTRMLIESFDREKMLYTYISLTETNEAKGFSKLFSERWFETLKERYPIFNFQSTLNLMKTILRENIGGFAEFLSVFSSFNFILTKNKKLCNTDLRINAEASPEISNLFGNVREIVEELWIIVIDEIERATLDEVMRVIEVVERFKNEAQWGFPIKIIFILCYDRESFEKNLEKIEQKYEALLIKDFFISDPKSIEYSIDMPPISVENRRQHIVKRLQKIQKERKIYVEEELDIEIDWSNSDSNIGRVYYFLTNQSLRTIDRCLNNFSKQIVHFQQNSDGMAIENIARLHEFLMLACIKITYPQLFDFLKDIIFIPIPYTNHKHDKSLKDALSKKFSKEKEEIEEYSRIILLAIPGLRDWSNFFSEYQKRNDEQLLSMRENLQFYFMIQEPEFRLIRAVFESEKNEAHSDDFKEESNQLNEMESKNFGSYLIFLRGFREKYWQLKVRALNVLYSRMKHDNIFSSENYKYMIYLMYDVIKDLEENSEYLKKYSASFLEKNSGLLALFPNDKNVMKDKLKSLGSHYGENFWDVYEKILPKSFYDSLFTKHTITLKYD